MRSHNRAMSRGGTVADADTVAGLTGSSSPLAVCGLPASSGLMRMRRW